MTEKLANGDADARDAADDEVALGVESEDVYADDGS